MTYNINYTRKYNLLFMNKNSNNEKIDKLLVINELDINFFSKFRGENDYNEVRDLLNKKMFRVADTPFTYRQINALDDDKILEDNRTQKSNWREFSLKELIYLSVIKELKSFGVVNGQMKELKKVFFLGRSKRHLAHTEKYLLASMKGIKIILLFGNDSAVSFHTVNDYMLFERDKKPSIHINLNQVIFKILAQVGEKQVDYKKEWDYVVGKVKLTQAEQDILDIINNKDYKTITVRKSNNKDYVIKAERIADIKKEDLIKIINDKDFATITAVKQSGKIVYITVEDSFKI